MQYITGKLSQSFVKYFSNLAGETDTKVHMKEYFKRITWMLVKLVALSCRLLLSRKLCVLEEVTQEKTLCSRRETKRVSWQKSCAQCRFTKLKCYFNSNIVFISPFENKDRYNQVFKCAHLYVNVCFCLHLDFVPFHQLWFITVHLESIRSTESHTARFTRDFCSNGIQ